MYRTNLLGRGREGKGEEGKGRGGEGREGMGVVSLSCKLLFQASVHALILLPDAPTSRPHTRKHKHTHTHAKNIYTHTRT